MRICPSSNGKVLQRQRNGIRLPGEVRKAVLSYFRAATGSIRTSLLPPVRACVLGAGRGGRVWGVEESQGIRRGTKDKIEVKVSEGEEDRTKQPLEKETQQLMEWKAETPVSVTVPYLHLCLAWLHILLAWAKMEISAILEVVI